MIKVGILNVTGYAGAELARLLWQHPEVEITGVTGRSAAGEKLGDIFPHLSDLGLIVKPELDASVDIVFSALPHNSSAEQVIPLLDQGARVVDLSADFRLKDPSEYSDWYGVEHPSLKHLQESVYGLTELHRNEISTSNLVANPGCYSTAAILALAPVVKEGLIDIDIVIDSKSGVSGAGRTLSEFTHYSEVNETVQAYSVKGHRHLPEIVQELGQTGNMAPVITFLTHLVPITRGILSSCYATFKQGSFQSVGQAEETIKDLYNDFYEQEPFIRISKSPPHTKHLLGSNFCFLYPLVDPRTERLIVISCLDNLIKGAAGQAVQNMNVMLELPETMGLKALAVYP